MNGLTAETKKLSIGFSPCPNDTFIFDALVHGRVGCGSVSFDKEVLADVEALNEWALAGRLDVTKLSFHAFGHVLDEYALLSSGSALGRGCGPLLVTKESNDGKELAGLTIAIPGKYTTAAMLLKLFLPGCKETVPMRFDAIMPSIANGSVDAGVIIHESRFTYQEKKLALIQDLGEWWEETTGCPIPLGGIVAKKSLGKDVLGQLASAIRASIQYAYDHPQTAEPYIKENAQELDDKVIRQHIDLYVNPFSIDLGDEGVEAVKTFLERGQNLGIIPDKGDFEII